MQWNREASAKTRGNDLPEVQRQPGFHAAYAVGPHRAADKAAASAPSASRGTVRSVEPNSRDSGPDAPARGGGLGRAAGPEGASDAPAQSGRGAAALGRAPERASGPEVFSKFLKEDPWSTDDPWRAGAGAQGSAGRVTAYGKQSGGGARGPHGGKGRPSGDGKGNGDWSQFRPTLSSSVSDRGAHGPQGERGAHGPQEARGLVDEPVGRAEHTFTGTLTPDPKRRLEHDVSSES